MVLLIVTNPQRIIPSLYLLLFWFTLTTLCRSTQLFSVKMADKVSSWLVNIVDHLAVTEQDTFIRSWWRPAELKKRVNIRLN